MNREKVLGLIMSALEDLRDMTDEDLGEFNKDTCLFGTDATLDSLSLVSLIVDVETNLIIESGVSIALTDDRALSQEISPFDTVTTLMNYIVFLLEESNALSE